MRSTRLLGFDFGRATLSDVVAGFSVAMVLVPQSMAYAELAGLPAYRGLYAAALPPIAAALFASSPYLQTGPVALTSLLTASALAALGPGGPRIEAAALLALIVGLARISLGLLRAGVVAYLMSEPLLIGFTSAASIIILATQIPAAVGLPGPESNAILGSALRALRNPGQWNAAAVLISVGGAVVIAFARRVHPLIPGALVALALSLGYAMLATYPGPVVGDIPIGLPPLNAALPWTSAQSLLLPGLVIALIGFAEPASIARTFAARERRMWDPDRELVSQGAANVVAGLTGGFPVGGSFSRSSLNREAGARTSLSGAVAGLTVLAFLPFSGLLALVPRAALAAIVISAVAGLIRLRSLLGLWRLSGPQCLVAWVTFILTLALSPHIEQAVILGIVLAVAVHLWRELPVDLRTWTEGDTLLLEPRGVLWFGSAHRLEEAFLGLLSRHADARRLVVRLGRLGRVDLTGALVLRTLLGDARAAGLSISVEDMPPRAEPMLRRALGSLLEPDPHGGAGDTPSAESGQLRDVILDSSRRQR